MVYSLKLLVFEDELTMVAALGDFRVEVLVVEVELYFASVLSSRSCRIDRSWEKSCEEKRAGIPRQYETILGARHQSLGKM